ncbi:MAG: hypothetical protein HYZ23_02370 [Chloroflexi bacterium]|nr:hypothetical protein [Chloroflexota bacterium]
MFKICRVVALCGILILLVACASPAATQPTAPPDSTESPIPAATEAPATEGIKLVLPTYPDNVHLFYIELIEKSLTAAGVPYTLEFEEDLPQLRAVEMLDQGELSLMWLVASAERDTKYTRVNVGLTNGLIGRRILLIPAGQGAAYENVQNLEDFRNLGKVGAFGKGWFDVKVWDANGLPYQEIDGEWRVIYDMLAKGDRGLDYFSRGFTEIVSEASEHPDLEIEKHLVLIYNRDFYFYLSSSAVQYKDTLEAALLKAQKDGLIDELAQKYWADSFTKLNMDARIQIELETPQ